LLTKLRQRFPKIATHMHAASEKARTLVNRTSSDS
jgi:hypothetical protein